jgi:hypothetical protein
VTSPEPAIISEPYQQIIAVFTPDRGGLRAKDVCLALGIGTEPKDTETQPGLFTLSEKRS